MELLLVVVVAFMAGISGTLAYQRYKRSRKRIAPGPSDTGYDERIDALTDDGMKRLQIHRAMTDPTKRSRLRGTPHGERAAEIFGWDA